jgi:hypothetical protein
MVTGWMEPIASTSFSTLVLYIMQFTGNVVGREFLIFSSMTGHVRTSFLVGFVKDFLDITHFHHIPAS